MEPLALYIHWPFCLAKCPYCDFNSHVRKEIPEQRFGAALLRELEWEAGRLGARPLASIFFGGGTPSLMQPEIVFRLIETASRFFSPLPDIEITLEANPTSVERGKLAAIREAGVNRLSLGVQSLDDAALRFLGRQHSAAEARAALAVARELFPRVSFDLIYARPGQDVSGWQTELHEALAFGPDHLSLYQLTIEPATPFAALYAQAKFALPPPETAALLYDVTTEEAAKSGLRPYEISNYARPGAECRHNLGYWRYRDYAGIGPGAHGRVSIGDSLLAVRRRRAPEAWAARVEASGHGTDAEEVLSPAERAREMLLMGLRLTEGIDPDRFRARTGLALLSAVDRRALADLLAAEYLAWCGKNLAATEAGRIRLDALLARLVL
ncbi:MAG: radical SAM family heme chaperone HemW [Acetobacteraceae bacterium]